MSNSSIQSFFTPPILMIFIGTGLIFGSAALFYVSDFLGQAFSVMGVVIFLGGFFYMFFYNYKEDEASIF